MSKTSKVMKVYKEFDNFYDFAIQQYVERYNLIAVKSIAQRVGCALSSIYRWKHQGPRSVAVIEALAKDLHCTTDQILIIKKYYLNKHKEETK